MKNIVIVHRWEGNPEEPLYQWLKEELEKDGYNVVTPSMPNPDEPEIEAWIEKLYEVLPSPSEETVLVGHSVGCQTILRALERLPDEVTFAGVVLLAPWKTLPESVYEEEGEEIRTISRPWVESEIDYEKVKVHAKHFACIFSDNDFFVAPDQKDYFEKHLTEDTVLLSNKGHFTEDEGVTALPELLNAVKRFV